MTGETGGDIDGENEGGMLQRGPRTRSSPSVSNHTSAQRRSSSAPQYSQDVRVHPLMLMHANVNARQSAGLCGACGVRGAETMQ
ncbi:hypothetical protein EYF80_026676 [Liparis tanakae]|uniref:Uncharacterized protein n=1 Tax=Liparis tanakae TaxID=230148 RepID=A0A4Z2HC11_9TELE|nr:hypothetical protein EYF80_026676 [Liparis tanakae]